MSSGLARQGCHDPARVIQANPRSSKRAKAKKEATTRELSSLGLSHLKHVRVRSACARCRLKKSKCDGEFPCKRCTVDGMVCTAGVTRKTGYKQLPDGYADVLEHIHFTLIATIQKLYEMARKQQPWDLGEPGCNESGQPVIHNIASSLGCIHPSDLDRSANTSCSGDGQSVFKLACPAKEKQEVHEYEGSTNQMESSPESRNDLSDHSGFSMHHSPSPLGSPLENVFGGAGNAMAIYSDSLDERPFLDLDTIPSPAHGEADSPCWSQATPVEQSDPVPTFMVTTLDPSQLTTCAIYNEHNLAQCLMDSDALTMKPHWPASVKPGVMMGIGDPMIFEADDTDLGWL